MAYSRVLGAALLCYAALGAVLRVLPHHLEADLGAGPVAVGLAVGAPAITGLVARPLGGRLADRHGPRKVLAAGAVATVPAWVASRLVVGAGEGLMMSAAVLWLLRLGGPHRRGRALGHIGLANYGGLACGPLLADGAGTTGRVLALAAALPLAAVALTAGVQQPATNGAETASVADLVKATLRPGAGLMLVNVGYAALLAFGTGQDPLVVPLFAAAVISARTAGAAIPDRAGPRATLAAAAPTAAAGLVTLALATSPATAVAGAVAAGAGQALAVPALGLLALANTAPSQHGAAAGLFFAWFDAGVGLGGPAAGLIAAVNGPSGALLGAAVAVACTVPVALITASRGGSHPLVN